MYLCCAVFFHLLSVRGQAHWTNFSLQKWAINIWHMLMHAFAKPCLCEMVWKTRPSIPWLSRFLLNHDDLYDCFDWMYSAFANSSLSVITVKNPACPSLDIFIMLLWDGLEDEILNSLAQRHSGSNQAGWQHVLPFMLKGKNIYLPHFILSHNLPIADHLLTWSFGDLFNSSMYKKPGRSIFEVRERRPIKKFEIPDCQLSEVLNNPDPTYAQLLLKWGCEELLLFVI